MEELNELTTYATTHTTSPNKETSSIAQSGTERNQILAALPEADLERLVPYLEPTFLPAGMELRSAGVQATDVYFLVTGVASQFYLEQDGKTTELALIGSEGMIGVESFLGGESMPMQSAMLCAGHGFKIKVTALLKEFYRSDATRRVLLHYTQALLTQIEQTAVCNRHHAVEQRFCRFLLLCLDRLPSNELSMTQDLIANMLGVRREGVTEAARKLQSAGLIDYRRGHINVLNRVGLEQHVCECYAVVKKEYLRLGFKEIFLAAKKSSAIEYDSSTALHLASMLSKHRKFDHVSP